MLVSIKNILKKPLWALASGSIAVAFVYWVFVASDRYVSEATIVLDTPEIAAPNLSFSSLFTGGGNTQDLLLLREHLLSVDMLIKLQRELDFITHFSAGSIDRFSRIATNAYIEDIHRFYLKRISVEIDEYSSVLRLSVQSHDPHYSKQIASFLLESGEAHMNAMGQKLAEEQVAFMERQVQALDSRVLASRSELIAYQNEYGQISPTSTVEALSLIIAELESELSQLKAQKQISLAYLSTNSADIIKLDAEIAALQKQIEDQQSRMAATSGQALNEVTAGYMALERQLKFNIDMYGSALAALENTRVEAARTLKQISVIQAPTLPEYAVKPARWYNALSVAVVVAMLALILQMVLVLVKEHRD